MPSLNSISRNAGSMFKRLSGTSRAATVFLGGIAKDRDPLFRFGDGIAAEAREADGKIGGESARAQILVYGVGPFLRRGVEMLQAGAVEPKDAGFLRRRFDFGSKAHEMTSQFGYGFFTFSRCYFAGAQRRSERKCRGVTQAGKHALLTRLLVDPENQPLRFVFGHHRRRITGPVGMAPEQQLQRKGRQINTGQPVRCRALHNARSGRAVCL